MRAALLALACLLPLLAAPGSQADVSLVRVVAGDVTFADGTFTFRDHIVVPPGATLTFRNATVWLDADRACTEDPVDPSVCVPQLAVHGALVVQDSTLDTHRWAGHVGDGFLLNVERGTARITGSTLRHYSGFTFYQRGPAPSLVEGNLFQEGAEPVRFMQGVEAAFRRNVMADVREGVEVSDASVPVEENVFRNVTRTYGVGSLNWAIALRSASPGDHAWSNAAPVRGNLVEGATAGIMVASGRPSVIEDNVIRGVEAGLLLVAVQDGQALDRHPPVVRRNLVDGARIGIRLSGNGAAGPGPAAPPPSDVPISLSDNALVNTRCIGIQVPPIPSGVRLSLDATGVWWGDGRGPRDGAGGSCPAILVQDETAAVDVSTWLRAPPEWAVPLVPGLRS